MKNEASRLVAMHLPRAVQPPALSVDDDPVPPNFFEKAGMEWAHDSDDVPGPGLSVVGHSSALSGLSSSLAGLPTLGGLGGSAPFLTHHQGGSLAPMRGPQKVEQRPLPPPPGPPAPSFR
ncbi:hypothetical protein FHG87_017922 [Trinorchestia longiramus]|nr:hypothetical protein FHG87_017922 [Trinorchestia longiramus]